MSIKSKLRALARRLDGKGSATPTHEAAVRESVTDAGYYQEISIRYASAQLVGILLLALFFALSLLSDSALLSANSLAVFAKDMTSSISLHEGNARDTLVYTADEENRYAQFREGLAVLGHDKLTVFTATGREAYTDRISYATPRLAASGRYLIAYDLGGTSYSLYNSFARVERADTESPIRTVAAANNGLYAIVTDGSEYTSLVTLYNERFRAINRYHIKEYTVCATLDEQGERLLLASVFSQEGRMATKLMLAAPGEEEASAEWTVEDVYPVAVDMAENGNVMLLSTDAVIWFDQKGNELARHAFMPEDVISYRLNEHGCLLLCRVSAERADRSLLVLDQKGREVYHVELAESVKDAVYDGKGLGVLTDEALLLYRKGEEQPAGSTSLTGAYTSLMSCGEHEFFVCGDAKTVVVRVAVK